MNIQDATRWATHLTIEDATRRATYWATERAIYRATEGNTNADIYRVTVEDIFSSTDGVTQLPIQEALKWN